MAVYKKNKRSYGISDPFVDVFSSPIVSERAPTVKDKAEIGTCWIDKPNNDVYFLTSVVANSSTWINSGGGGGVFDSITVTNNLTVTAGDFEVTAGSITIGALTAGTVRSSAAGLFSVLADGADGEILIGTTGGAAAWSTLTAGGGIAIAEVAGAITISNPGATGTTFGADVGGPVAPTAGGLTTFTGVGANLSTDGATANTVKIILADDIVSVASITATNDLTMTAGTCTITSDDNNAESIYLHADAGAGEGISIHSEQGVATDAIGLEATVGGIQLNAGIDSINAIVISASHAAGGIGFVAGTNGIALGITDGLFRVRTGTGPISIGADAFAKDLIIGNATGATSLSLLSGTGNLTASSTDELTLDSAGVLEINSSAGIIGIGNDAIAQNINIGTGAAARTITIGNTSGASSTVIDVGTGNLDLGVSATAHATRLGSTNTTSATTIQAGSGAVTVTAGGIFDVNAVGNVTIDSTGGTLGIGEGADAQNINIGTGAAARIITVGNATAASSIVLDVGTGNLDLGVSATAHTTRLGSTNTTCDTTIQSGTGAMTFTAGGALDTNVATDITFDSVGGIFDVSVTGNITIDSSAGTIGIGVDDIDQAINIGTNGERVITIGNQVGTAGVVIKAGTDGVDVNGSGLMTIELTVDTQAAAAVTVDANNGVGVFTGLTTASAASQQFTITNNLCTVNSRLLVTVANVGANDAKMSLERVTPLAGSFTLDVKNNGTQALNGDVIITFWMMQA